MWKEVEGDGAGGGRRWWGVEADGRVVEMQGRCRGGGELEMKAAAVLY